MNFLRHRKSDQIFKILAGTVAVITVATFYNRYIQADDNWFGEQAYWLAMEGKVKLKSIPMLFNWTEEFLVYHKLLIWMGAGVISLFGWSIFYLKALIFLFYLATLFVIFKYLKKENSASQWLGVFMFILIPMSLIKSFEFRPEIPMMCFGFLSYYLIHKYLKEDRLVLVFGAAFLAGLAFLTHLNAATFCVSGTLVLLVFKKYKASVLFAVVGGMVCVIYFVPLVIDGSLDQWFYNLKNWPSHAFEKNIDNSLWGILKANLVKLIGEQKRFFWDDTVSGISVLFFFSLIVRFKWLWREYRPLIFYTLFQVLFLALLGSHKAPRYLVLHFPLMVSIVAITFYSLSNKKLRIAFITIFAIQFLLFGYNTFKILKRNEPQVAIHNAVLSHIPMELKVLAPWDFIYNNISNYNFYCYKTYEYLQEHMDHKFSQLEFFELADKLGVEYIVLNKELATNYVWWIHNGEIESNPHFFIEKNLPEYYILRAY